MMEARAPAGGYLFACTRDWISSEGSWVYLVCLVEKRRLSRFFFQTKNEMGSHFKLLLRLLQVKLLQVKAGRCCGCISYFFLSRLFTISPTRLWIIFIICLDNNNKSSITRIVNSIRPPWNEMFPRKILSRLLSDLSEVLGRVNEKKVQVIDHLRHRAGHVTLPFHFKFFFQFFFFGQMEVGATSVRPAATCVFVRVISRE